jgi:hypothetical protein
LCLAGPKPELWAGNASIAPRDTVESFTPFVDVHGLMDFLKWFDERVNAT